MMEIANELSVTHAKVLYWLKKYNISRRSWRESAYIKQNPKGDPFVLPNKLSSFKKELLIAGLFLYWAEGSKGKNAIRLANLDHRMLVIFSKFLREVCQVNEKRLSLYVRVYKEFSLDLAQKYWSTLLNIPPAKVFVYPHTDRRSKANKLWSKYGIATLEFHSTKLKQWLDRAIEEYIDRLMENKSFIRKEICN